MQTASDVVAVSKGKLWTGRILSALPSLMLLFSAAMKLANAPGLAEGMGKLGWPVQLAVPLGILEIACTVIYLIPQTAVLGAILLTGYMGGAIATHVRVGDPVFVHILIGIAIWGGLYLRDPRLHRLLPVVR